MMLTVHGLPISFTYKDIKALFQSECHISDFILENLTIEGGLKKARVGIANDNEGHYIMKRLDGLRVQGGVLKVVGAGMSASHEERHRSAHSYSSGQPQPWSNQPQWQANPVRDSHNSYQQSYNQSRSKGFTSLNEPRSDAPQHNHPAPWAQQQVQNRPQFSQGFQDRHPKNQYGQGFSRQISPRRRLSPGRMSPGRRTSPGRRLSPSRRFSPGRLSPERFSPGRRFSPRRISSGRRFSPGRKMSPGRGFFPGRRMSPGRFSPGRRNSPGFRISPAGGRISPSERQEIHDKYRRMSPGRFSPSRRISPFRRHSPRRSPSNRRPPFGKNAPRREITPTRDIPTDRPYRQDFPDRRYSPRRSPLRGHSPNRSARYSPSQLEDDPIDKYDSGSSFRNVKPAYDKTLHRELFTSDYRPKDEDKHFPRRSPVGDTRWSNKEPRYHGKEDMNKQGLSSLLEQRVMEEHKKRSLTRDLRDRSPIRDYRKRSPSPHSSRQAWSREKQSPDISKAPPPPIWPSQNDTQSQGNSSDFSGKNLNDLEPWQRKIEELRRLGRQNIDEKRARSSERASPNRFVESDRFTGRNDRFERKNEELLPRERIDNSREKHISSRDKDRSRYDYRSRSKSPYKKDESINTKVNIQNFEILPKPDQFYKEIEEVCKRAEDFTKKTERLRKVDKGGSAKDDYKSLNSGQKGNGQFEIRKNEDKKTKDSLSKGLQIKLREKKTGAKSTKYELSAETKIKREKAVNEISEKLMSKYGRDFAGDLSKRIHQELKEEIGRILFDMFGNEDVSFIESVIKFNARHKNEMDIFKRVATSVLNNSTNLAAQNSDENDTPAEISRSSPVSKFSKEQLPVANVAQWNMAVTNDPAMYPIGAVPPVGVMVPMQPEYQYVPSYEPVPQPIPPIIDTNSDDYNLYLCKDDLSPFTQVEEEALKTFIVDKLFKFNQMSQGWSPEFTLSTQANAFRREIITKDYRSREWLLNLDFSEFTLFNVLIHTPEELWYVRAAIWLPGHSRCKNIEPLDKLKLQNKRLEGVEIGKWKFVKKIVTEKGTRLYVDIPPASSRKLAKYKMQLSYELQKVSVFLKADAVDKDVFDQGLRDKSITKIPSLQNAQMPLLPNEPAVTKFALDGNKQLNPTSARKIKDQIVYKLYKYLQEGGTSKTDFLKYGFCSPGHFGVVAENEESRRWLCSVQLGEILNKRILVVGGDNTRYIKTFIDFPKVYYTVTCTSIAFKNLRQCNQNVKGLNFDLWNNAVISEKRENCIEVEMDVESVETILKKGFRLNYILEHPVIVTTEYNPTKLADVIKKYKAEMSDTYDVANMDISDDDDIILCE